MDYCRVAPCKYDVLGPAVVIQGDILPPGAKRLLQIRFKKFPTLFTEIPGENPRTHGGNMPT